MDPLRFVGFVYSVALETGVLPLHFQCFEDAEKYCKCHYPNTVFQIIPIPLFTYKKKEGS